MQSSPPNYNPNVKGHWALIGDFALMGKSLRQGRGRVHQPVRSGKRECTLSLAPVRALAPVKGLGDLWGGAFRGNP